MQHQNLLIDDADGVRTLTIHRPERRNAMDSTLAAALLNALREADMAPIVGAVLLTATGSVFCAGADLGEFKGERADPDAESRRSDLFLELQLAFEQIRVPVVCALTGAAIGAGASIAIAADLTVMGEGARLAYPEIVHGMVPSLVIGHLQKRIGRKQAFDLLATGDPVYAPQALALGLASRVLPDADVLEGARTLARSLASRDRRTMRETKELFVTTLPLSLPDALRAGREAGRMRQARAAQAALQAQT
ncbi:enoyl-CoA hydratase/isomerase family protein [Hydrogenophaga sp. BPS33]|uniref:enoyl-CoA hydratase/isomerase family protein n=1 Tax=Hydrogenophaga sp. BPS33 TaxID=2651974 RepID=UPI00131FEA82|nr:enoyl-CoA hydratase/isomerase family protein [Hydrogenophaga sp. BPS33]QHE84764.1 enoyl-CoA hydratase/isomerase family protein [Hydrogenophaga sp. BPS33]